MNNYNERFLKNVLEDIREEQDEALLKEIEEAKNNPLFANKEGEAAAFAEEYGGKKTNKRKIFLRIASIVLVLVIAVSFIPMPVDGEKSSLAEIIVNFFSTEFFSVGNNETDSRYLDYEGDYIPTYIPEGYKLTEIINDPERKSIVFENEGNLLVISELILDANLNIDYSEKENIQEIEILGYKSIYFTDDDSKNVHIITDKTIINITCSDKSVDIVGFAKKIEKR